MKKVIALGLAAIFSASAMHADQQNWNTANTFLRFETPFQTASPERVALFNTEDHRTKHRGHSARNGDVQFVIFGNQNTNKSDAAAYYMPNGSESLVFNASFDDQNDGTDTAVTLWSGAQGGVTQAQFDQGLFYDIAVSTGASTAGTVLTQGSGNGASGTLDVGTGGGTANAILNAGTTGSAATAANQFMVGTGVSGVYNTFDLSTLSGLVGDADGIGDFVMDANKNLTVLRPWNFGVGYAPNVQMGSDIYESAFVSTITPELKRSFWAIGATWKQILSNNDDKGFFLELSTVLQRVTMDMELNEVVTTDFVANPYGDDDDAAAWVSSWSADAGNTSVLENMTQAFAQDAWNYGKVDGAQSVTRLADIELKLGYQFICDDNIMSNMFVGIVIPTGNKAQAVYLAEPIVGNGFHFGIMLGGTQEIQLDMGTKTRWSMRSDTSFRYLFQNTQMRSIDTMTNGQWSRYMMVWPDYATQQADGQGDGTLLRAYQPGINYFTQEMYVTPRAQARINEAIVLEHGSFKAEFGWNMMIRQAEEVSLVNVWEPNLIAFVDASNVNTSLYNQTRTIYNDSYQSTPLSGNVTEDNYNFASVSASDLNLDSAASPAIYTNTPYLALGYAFNEEKSSVFSIGASYEISATNGYINDWTLWGKFGFTF